MNAQGEDVVAGYQHPASHIRDLKKELPKVYDQLCGITAKLEKHYRDVQDFEFTVEKGNACTCSRRGTGSGPPPPPSRSPWTWSRRSSSRRKRRSCAFEPQQIDQLLHPVDRPEAKRRGRSPRGSPPPPARRPARSSSTADKAVEWAASGKDVILVRKETSPDDIHGMDAARGILTAKGGMTSHAAVVARGRWGRRASPGATSIDVDEATNRFMVGGKVCCARGT